MGAQGAMVGKAAIGTSRELREFETQDPWTADKARELGPGAPEEWVSEQNTPDLDRPPKISEQASKHLIELTDSIHLKETPFSEEQWSTIAENGDELITSVGTLSEAAHCFVAKSRYNRNPTTLTPGKLAIYQGRVRQELLDSRNL